MLWNFQKLKKTCSFDHCKWKLQVPEVATDIYFCIVTYSWVKQIIEKEKNVWWGLGSIHGLLIEWRQMWVWACSPLWERSRIEVQYTSPVCFTWRSSFDIFNYKVKNMLKNESFTTLHYIFVVQERISKSHVCKKKKKIKWLFQMCQMCA